MPNEMITLQLGQCGNQSKTHLFFCVQQTNLTDWIDRDFSLVYSWLWVLEAIVLGARHITKWNSWRFCNRWWLGSEGCVFLSGRWWSLHSAFGAFRLGTTCHSFNYEFTVCQSKWKIVIVLTFKVCFNKSSFFSVVQSRKYLLVKRWRRCRQQLGVRFQPRWKIARGSIWYHRSWSRWKWQSWRIRFVPFDCRWHRIWHGIIYHGTALGSIPKETDSNVQCVSESRWNQVRIDNVARNNTKNWIWFFFTALAIIDLCNFFRVLIIFPWNSICFICPISVMWWCSRTIHFWHCDDWPAVLTVSLFWIIQHWIASPQIVSIFKWALFQPFHWFLFFFIGTSSGIYSWICSNTQFWR